MIYIKTIIKNSFFSNDIDKKILNCSECQTSCQSACKTSCTVSNQKCENFRLKNKSQNNK